MPADFDYASYARYRHAVESGRAKPLGPSAPPSQPGLDPQGAPAGPAPRPGVLPYVKQQFMERAGFAPRTPASEGMSAMDLVAWPARMFTEFATQTGKPTYNEATNQWEQVNPWTKQPEGQLESAADIAGGLALAGRHLDFKGKLPTAPPLRPRALPPFVPGRPSPERWPIAELPEARRPLALPERAGPAAAGPRRPSWATTSGLQGPSAAGRRPVLTIDRPTPPATPPEATTYGRPESTRPARPTPPTIPSAPAPPPPEAVGRAVTSAAESGAAELEPAAEFINRHRGLLQGPQLAQFVQLTNQYNRAPDAQKSKLMLDMFKLVRTAAAGAP